MQGFPSRQKEAIFDALLLSKIIIERPNDDDGMIHITIEKEALDCLAKGWRNSVVIKLLGRSLVFHILERKLREMWKPSGSFVIVDLPNGYSIVRFENEQDFYGVLTGGPWTIFSQCLIVKNWTPTFNLVKDCIKTICAWVRVSNLPILLYDDIVIKLIASSLGCPLRVDKNTLYTTWGKFARCIELDLSKPLQGAIIVNGEQINVEYEGLGEICLGCGRQGHLVNRCPALPSEPVGEKVRSPPENQSAPHAEPSVEERRIAAPSANSPAPGSHRKEGKPDSKPVEGKVEGTTSCSSLTQLQKATQNTVLPRKKEEKLKESAEAFDG
ncbi:hypothetical protein V2J09_014855 [Rumex salicifolius]